MSAAEEAANLGARRLAWNTVVPMAAGLAARLLDLLFALVYLRVLGQGGTGVFQFLIVLTTYLDTVVNFGLNTILARDLARRVVRADDAFRAVALLRLALWLGGGVVVAVMLGPLREPAGLPPDAVLAGWLFYLGLLPGIVGMTATGLLWGYERLDVPAAMSVVGTLLKVVLGVFALAAGFGMTGLAANALLVNVLAAAVLVTWLRQISRQRTPPPGAPDANVGEPRGVSQSFTPSYLMREAWPLFLNQLLASLFFRIDSLLLPGLASARQAGAYAAGYKVIDGLGVISSSFTLAIFPRLARHGADDPPSLARAYRLSLRLLLQVAFPLMAGVALLSEQIVAIVAGTGFLPDGATALAILVIFLPLSFANGLAQYVLIALGRQRFLTAVFFAALAFNLTANLALIPAYGFVAAAWVTVASEIVLLLPFYGALRRSVPGVSLLAEVRAPVLATLLMTPVVWWLRDSIHPAAAVMAGALIYPTALWAVNGVDDEEWRLIRDLLGWIRVGRGPRLPRAAY